MADKITVVVCEPGKRAEVREIENDLRVLQSLVDGYIEAIRIPSRNVVLVCDEEGKLKDLAPCRTIIDETGNEILDVIYGTFFFCGVDEDDGNFASLSKKDIEWVMDNYGKPLMMR